MILEPNLGSILAYSAGLELTKARWVADIPNGSQFFCLDFALFRPHLCILQVPHQGVDAMITIGHEVP